MTRCNEIQPELRTTTAKNERLEEQLVRLENHFNWRSSRDEEYNTSRYGTDVFVLLNEVDCVSKIQEQMILEELSEVTPRLIPAAWIQTRNYISMGIDQTSGSSGKFMA